jgi:MFS family permease
VQLAEQLLPDDGSCVPTLWLNLDPGARPKNLVGKNDRTLARAQKPSIPKPANPRFSKGSLPVAFRHYGTAVFSILFLLLVSYQSILLTVVPLEAHEVLGNAQQVSEIYLAVGIVTMLGRQSIPWLVSLLGRKWTFAAGCGAMIVGVGLLIQRNVASLIPGMVLTTLSFAIIEVSLNLYLLDNMSRAELADFEPRRIVRTTPAWLVGPWLGVFLATHLARWVPFAVAAVIALSLISLFLYLGLPERTPASPQAGRSLNPLRYFPRYFRQKRLVLAWLMAIGRGSWWSVYFVYAPIFAVTHGLGDDVAGLLVSVGAGWSACAMFWRRVGSRIAMRRLLFGSFAISGFLSIAVAVASGWAWVAAIILALAAFAAESIDAVGNNLFLRAVHPYERAEMTAVYVSYRDVAQIAPPGIFAFLLMVFQLPAVFVATGTMMLAMSRLTRFVPRRF